MEKSQLFRRTHRKRAEQHLIVERKNRCSCSDAERKCANCRNGKDGRLAQGARGEPDIVPHNSLFDAVGREWVSASGEGLVQIPDQIFDVFKTNREPY
jgi:hypothetical protein